MGLVYAFYFKRVKYHYKNKEIIHRERFFYQVTCEELHGLFMSVVIEKVQRRVKRKSNTYPDNTPYNAAFKRFLTLLVISYIEIDIQHNPHHKSKEYPESVMYIQVCLR
jgi:hypothetical protein